jgi:hypothetical protein
MILSFGLESLTVGLCGELAEWLIAPVLDTGARYYEYRAIRPNRILAAVHLRVFGGGRLM